MSPSMVTADLALYVANAGQHLEGMNPSLITWPKKANP
jgi:hypothetical protein